MFKVGEALVGEEPNVAHIDLVIGKKNGPAGKSFLNGMTNPTQGHTPLLGVIRPNLPTKPSTLIVPKVTVQDMEDSEKVFGPAQMAISRAIADSMEEGIIDEEKAEEYVVIVSVFIHPQAEDYQKIYRYNYGATKLALKRAIQEFPESDTVLEEKDKGGHPVMGSRLTKLFDPPYLQVALDIPDLDHVKNVISSIPKNDHIIYEVGTPLVKKYGVGVVEELRKVKEDAFIVVDLKTLDTGNLEARMVSDAGGDGVVISGLAPNSTIEKSIEEAEKTGIYSIVDTLNVDKPLELIEDLDQKPKVVELHRAIDVEGEEEHGWQNIESIKKQLDPDGLVAVAGGIRSHNIRNALKSGADLLVVGRAITNAKDPQGAVREFIEQMEKPDVDQFRVKTDF
ncbi:MAG: D-arabino 3-hexulose 6-phosphate formaldehyde lyase [Candidatus Methanohalarchaeum thermophilum]|uniref:Bifunctional enzyme Fae/Hps n=1 Tax=Methanohalarchaeum thermophilum TaxID=1903181 RepID=A0A1Q6DW15_METT1|nr:MAG: D-arabino 3-hexulose 6-phosphate formaldehyde lyase [Candidatus Methanohalarchaeum thermophilum]